MSETVIVSPVTNQVQHVLAGVGTVLIGAALTLSSSAATVTINEPTVVGRKLRVGLAVQLRPAAGGPAVNGKLSRIGRPTSSANLGITDPITVVFNRSTDSQRSNNWQVNIIPKRSPEVLAVPESAIFTSADGSLSILLVKNGRTQSVSIGVGQSASGYVQIHTSEVKPGDEVVVSSAATP